MKFLPLYDLQQEINRLFVAGSKFAKNDPRLQKQAAIFNRLGENSPVLRKIADGIDALVNAESVDSADRLLEISTLLYSVLYTQGETFDTEQQESKLMPALPAGEIRTDKSYLALKPLVESLTLKKGNRLDDLQMAFENGQCNDFRIYPLLDAALTDSYSEFANYIETAVIPAIGKKMIPFLLNGFSYKGLTGDVRRFRLLNSMGYSGISEMVDSILKGESVQLQVEAIKTLGNDPKNEELLIKFAGDRKKAIRVAAYKAMAELSTETTLRVLFELFTSGKRKHDTRELGEALRMNVTPSGEDFSVK
ncbi:MAG: HEAT repeat domain-containing protein [Prevotellaceae bacterium]|jgi:hypothetical protein|nr:HEAT repeat domain-containing protein [Prevotellaceae bacterium]